MKDTIINWGGALLLALGMAVVQWDGIPDHSGEMAQSKAELRAQRIEDQIAASRAADYELCKKDHGENVGVAYLPDGSHRCTLKNGRPIRNQIVVAVKK